MLWPSRFARRETRQLVIDDQGEEGSGRHGCRGHRHGDQDAARGGRAMTDPFEELDWNEELSLDRWTQEETLHTPTFEATIKPDGTLWLRGAALREGFSVEAAQALTRFLSERVKLPPVEPPYDFGD